MYQEELILLDKKMSRIEKRDSDFAKNSKWQKLKKLQEDIYYKKAVDELYYRTNKTQNEKDLQRIKKCKEYIERYEQNGINNGQSIER